MRVLLVIMFATLLVVATPAAEASDGAVSSGSTTTSSTSTSTGSSTVGPEPSGCRPYCFEG